MWTFATKRLETHTFGFLEPVLKQVSLPGLPSCFGSINRLLGNLQSCAAPRCELCCGTFPYLSELGRELPELPVCLGCGIKTDSKQQCCPHTVWLTYKMEVEGSRSYPKPVQLIFFFLNVSAVSWYNEETIVVVPTLTTRGAVPLPPALCRNGLHAVNFIFNFYAYKRFLSGVFQVCFWSGFHSEFCKHLWFPTSGFHVQATWTLFTLYSVTLLAVEHPVLLGCFVSHRSEHFLFSLFWNADIQGYS